MKSEYLSIDDIAKMLKVTYLTVYRWVKSEKLKSYQAGRQHRIKTSDLDIFLKKEKVTS